MDPLSLAAGIGGLIALTLQVIKLNKDYIDSVKHAPKVIRQYHQELLMLQSSLTLLQERLSDPDVREYLDRKQQQLPEILQDTKNGIDGCSIALRKMISSIAKKDKTPSIVTRMSFHFNESEIEKDVQRLQRYRSMLMDNFNHALSIAHSQHLNHLVVTTAEVDRLSQMILQDLHLLKESVNRVEETGNQVFASAKLTQQDVARLSQMENASYRNEILSWLSTTDPSVNHGSARKLHEGDTGRWLIDSPAYSDWYYHSGRFFWLYGIAGSGKTILCSTLIEDVRQRTEVRANHDVQVAYVYFSFQDLNKQSTDYLIRTLIRQLFSGGSITWMAITNLYDKCSMGGQQPSQTALLDLLVQAIEQTSRTFIMVDALDECIDKENAVDIILELFERLSGKLNILVTSRHETFIEDSLSDIDTQRLAKVPIRNAAVDKDISDFVRSRMEKDRKLRKWRTESDYIVETLVSQAGGMFRWVACQLDALQKSRSVNELHQALKSLPKTLELTYERILSQIDENDRHRARALLQWLAYRDSSHDIFHIIPSCVIPSWTLPQIAEAVAITADKTFELGDRFQEPRELLDIASSLVSADESIPSELPRIFVGMIGALDGDKVETVRLAHASVLEYLESARLRESSLAIFHISPEEAHVFLAKSCLRYLLFFDDTSINDGDYNSWNILYPMLDYAANSWAFHLSQIQPDTKGVDDVHALALKVLDVNRQCFKTWQAVVSNSNLIAPLAFALQNKLPGLFKALIDDGHDPSKEETLMNLPAGYLFELAIGHNQPLSAMILLGGKVYLEKVEHKLKQFLGLALEWDKSEIISLLIDHDERSMIFTGLVEAMKDDHHTRVLSMVRPSFRINAYSKWASAEGTILSYAVLFGRLPLVVSFLQNGADAALEIQQAELPGGARFSGSILSLAFLLGFTNIFDVLCSTGHVSIDATFTLVHDDNTFVGNLLFHQTSQPNLAKVLVLLGKGPDLEIEHEITQETGDERVKGTAIHNAIFQGETQLLQLLVCAGANPDAPCSISRGNQTIALVPSGLWSMVGEQADILDFLLANGARANLAHDPLIMPPLISHITRLRVQAARTLLEHGADIHYHGRYGTPLYHAAHLFDKRLELILRDAGAQNVSTVSYWVGL